MRCAIVTVAMARRNRFDGLPPPLPAEPDDEDEELLDDDELELLLEDELELLDEEEELELEPLLDERVVMLIVAARALLLLAAS